MIGTLARIPHGKYFAFVKASGTDYFFHRDDFNGNWGELEVEFHQNNEPIKLKFEINNDSTKGPRAKNVERV